MSETTTAKGKSGGTPRRHARTPQGGKPAPAKKGNGGTPPKGGAAKK